MIEMTGETIVPDALRELWRQRARLLASNVATNSREHREIAQAASIIRQDYHDRFLVELLQNANDQALLGGVFDSTCEQASNFDQEFGLAGVED